MLKRIRGLFNAVTFYFRWRYHSYRLTKRGELRTVVAVKYLKKGRFEVDLSNGYCVRVPNCGWRPKPRERVRFFYDGPLKQRIVAVKDSRGVRHEYPEVSA